jgi:hypothetical protein
MAISVSVTVSIGELRKGVLSTTLRVMRVRSDTADAWKSMKPGSTRKSGREG